MRLAEKLKQLPSEPGVYQYFDQYGKLLYVGKAKVLKNRVKSYFQFTPKLAPSSQLSYRITKMISEVVDLNYIVVPTENDALILENSLIKQLKPKYNILLRDDKTYPYIYIDTKEEFPRLEITRKILKSKTIKYFGPFSVGARDMLDSIYEILPLVQKKSCVSGKKACLFYQIKKCLAPCEGKITPEKYQEFIDKALDYIHNKSKLIKDLEIKMEKLSQEFRFEDAMVLRDRITTIKKSELKSSLDFANTDKLDLFCVVWNKEENRSVVIKMFIRNGKLISTTHNFIQMTEISEISDVYKTAIINHYNHDILTIPDEILVVEEIDFKVELENFIFEQVGKKISISIPKIGKKKQLCELAIKNANELLKLDNKNEENKKYINIKELLELYNIPYRFECFDNSQMMGQATVGSMIVWDNNMFKKGDYRLYNLSELDEYHQMKEMLTRRVDSFDKNPPPDMWVIDGGKALVNLALDILNSVGVCIPVIGIAKEKVDAKAYRAKGAAKDLLYTDRAEILKLETSDTRLHFFQRLRDEAHRTAINFHKKQKRKEDKQISLLEIKGFGKAKVQKLLNYFGAFETIKEASLEELQEVLNEKDAIILFNYFKNKSD
jgi:excinuclease ABC subunit C